MAQYIIPVCVLVSDHADVYVREWLFSAPCIRAEEVYRDHVPILLERFDYLIDLFCVFWMSLVLRQCYRLIAFGNNVCVPMEKSILVHHHFHRLSPHNDIA